MSMHVYIARDGFRDTPILDEEWLSAAIQCNEVLVKEASNRNEKVWHTVILKSDNKQRLSLTENGLIHAQNPSKELIEVMFILAQPLNSKVYSERSKPYESVADWEKRTENYRENRNKYIDEYKRNWYKRKPFLLLVALVIGILIVIVKG